ncbi:putative pentatricopeptide repeat-containing protein at3g23330 [Phtheirospermum japonicum]|uniref:Putative pentatricopeptide repeat-containing protein at3g23330 n=1 Tax=Phtheirospermum japonicum TaxID=374723 RepID=A0A830C924_9LAMI|nr:putative pentatricopeptide repeat-containing protein at3g23330 [Phtheirospermum japonicum]
MLDLDSDVYVSTALVDFYLKCGCFSDAKQVFDEMPERDVVAWNAMVSGFSSHGLYWDAIRFVSEMQRDGMEPNSSTLATVIRGCAKLNDSTAGRQLHGFAFKSGFSLGSVMVSNTLVSMYAKCGPIDDATRFFEGMCVRDSVSYSAMISGSVQNGHAELALRMFRKMRAVAGVEPEPATMMGFFPACSNLAALLHGVCGHGYSVVRGFTSDVSICNALIDMYSKCGKMDASRKVFDRMCEKDVVSWNTMLVGYGIHGLGREAILLFRDMKDLEGEKPDDVTFIALLSACSHSGLVVEGKHLFNVMSEEFNIIPKPDHYFCMVDMLGRAGLLNEAYELITNMPYEPDSHVWNALLSACRVHKNILLGEKVSDEIRALGPSSPGNFVLLFNLYTAARRWDDAANVRIQQRELGFKKKPGCSWIEVNGTVHGFVGGDWSHGQSSEIYKKLEELVVEMKRLGYSAESDFVYHDVEEEEKEKILLYHSEKLAVAYGIISLKANKPILVTKNLRVCGDCHTAMKYITVIVKREITVRDTSRFHHFRDGVCSCGDFW